MTQPYPLGSRLPPELHSGVPTTSRRRRSAPAELRLLSVVSQRVPVSSPRPSSLRLPPPPFSNLISSSVRVVAWSSAGSPLLGRLPPSPRHHSCGIDLESIGFLFSFSFLNYRPGGEGCCW
ncbi:hypothetical protein BS78_03G135500 [Paspalum vaginatum]|nr:hypothetical protein BS78_03G135500 [Paspalum vaginatum]